MNRDREIEEIQRRIKDNQSALSVMGTLMKNAIAEASDLDKKIAKMRIENSELMNRLKVLGKRKLKERMEGSE